MGTVKRDPRNKATRFPRIDPNTGGFVQDDTLTMADIRRFRSMVMMEVRAFLGSLDRFMLPEHLGAQMEIYEYFDSWVKHKSAREWDVMRPRLRSLANHLLSITSDESNTHGGTDAATAGVESEEE